MRYKSLHDWNVSPSAAVELQRRLRDRVELVAYEREARLIAGADVSFNKYSPLVYAGFVVIDARDWSIVDRAGAVVEVAFPYVPGLLSFREIPPLLEAWAKLETEPDVVMVDGQGIAHPRRLGIASHLGLAIEKPAIGCAKSLLTGRFEEPGPEAGSIAPLVDRGETVGAVVRTKTKVNPVFVSPGHLIDLAAATRIVLSCARGYRVPEPTRQAHLYVNELRRGHMAQAADLTPSPPAPRPL